MQREFHAGVMAWLLGAAAAGSGAWWLPEAYGQDAAAEPAAAEAAVVAPAADAAPVAPAETIKPPVLPGVIRPTVGRRPLTGAARPFSPTATTGNLLPTVPSALSPTARPGVIRSPATAGPGAVAATPADATDEDENKEASETTANGERKMPALKFENSPSDLVLEAYARETGRTLLFAPDAPKVNITLRSKPGLSPAEYLQAIEIVLTMHNIALLPIGEKFLRVVPGAEVRSRAIATTFADPEASNHTAAATGRLISQMIQLKYISIDEARTALESFKRKEGMLQLFERTNSILITDTIENVDRMIEIVRFLDQPRTAREVVNVRPIKYAKAATIKQRLEEIVAESLKAQQAAKESPQARTSGPAGIIRSVTPLPVPTPFSGVIRASPFARPASAPVDNPIVEALMDEAARGIVRGKVQIIADERTNIMIVITQPENMVFFDQIISVLDVVTTPDVQVDVCRLEYADATEVADMLNQLIGNAKAAEAPKSVAQGAAGDTTPGEYKPGEAPRATPRSETLAEAAARAVQIARSPGAAPAGEPGKSKVGELSKDNIKILANKRTNALIIMASLSDLTALREIIKDMDIMLSQVLIETVVLDVSLSGEIKTGIDWIQGIQHFSAGPGGFSMGSGGGGGGKPLDLLNIGSNLISTAAAGIQYFFSMPNINLNAVIQASSTDGRTKILSSPVLLTQDNKEASIESTELRYFFKGYTYIASGYGTGTQDRQSNVDQRNVGLTVKVTPRINLKGMVVLHVAETFEDLGDDQVIDGQKWPTIVSRKLSADIAVASGETVILGGLVRSRRANSSSKIPLLGDIPWIGEYLFGTTTKSETRSELLVFLTPYVLDTQESSDADTRRRKSYVNAEGLWTKGWSASKMADETITQKLAREKAERALQRAREKAEREAGTVPPTPVVPRFGTVSASVTTNTAAPAAGAAPAAVE